MLLALFRVIAARDRREFSRRLVACPKLARHALRAGATRQTSQPYYLREISHYAYAGDTALHIAAAAYQRDIAEKLVSKGANVHARNRRGAQPLHYAAEGAPGSLSWDPKAQADIISFLIAVGAKPNSPDKSGVMPLHEPCAHAVPPRLARCSPAGQMLA